MNGYYYLNFSDLSEDAQNQLIEDAINDLDTEKLKEEANLSNVDFETYLHEKAERHLYSFNYVFNI